MNNPLNAQAIYASLVRADHHMGRKNYRDAIPVYAEILRQQPENYAARYNAALCSSKVGAHEVALNLLLDIGLDRLDEQCMSAALRYSVLAGHFDQSRMILRASANQFPESRLIAEEEMAYLWLQGDINALKSRNESLGELGRQAQYLNNRALCLIDSDPDEAESVYLEAISRFPDDRELRLQLAFSRMRHTLTKETLALYELRLESRVLDEASILKLVGNQLSCFREGGLGDEVFAFTMAVGLSDHFSRVEFYASADLCGLLASLCPNTNIEVMPFSSTVKERTDAVPAMSLFYIASVLGVDVFDAFHSGLSLVDREVSSQHEVQGDDEKVVVFNEAPKGRFRVLKNQPTDCVSTHLAKNARVTHLAWEEEVFPSIEGDTRASWSKVDMASLSIGELAKLITGHNSVVAIPSTVAHLAGFLGVRGQVLVPRVGGVWYWHHSDSNGLSRFYPSLRLVASP